MAEKYLYCQTGKVEDVIFPGKAILTFILNGTPQRVLLWVKCFIHQGKTLEQTDNFIDKLSVGDTVYFDCHVYDKESRDHCQWYAAKASKDMPEEMQTKTIPRVRNQNGYISEVDPGKGVITFDFYDEEQRVIFVRSRFYYFGKRMSNKKNLRDFLSENDPLQFDAEQCEPSEDNYYCTWFATQVWKGKRPTTQGSTWTLSGPSDDVTADDSASNAGGIIRDTAEDFPSLGLPQGLTEKQGYKAFEVNTSVREGKGNVLSLFNEECGLALWMVRHNTWDTLFSQRDHFLLFIMSNLPHAEALFGASHGSSVPGQTYTNPYGNYTVVDTVTEDMLDLVHPHWYGFPPMNEMWYGLVAFFLSCMAMLAISGNFIVLYVFCCTKTLRSPSNYFVVNLALSDFILMFCMCPPLVINSYYHTWIFGPFWCQVYGAIGSLTGCTSIFTMVCISFDRYNVIVKGIGAKPLTTGNALVQIVIVWLTSAVWTFVPFFGWGRYIPEGNMTACGTDYLSEDVLTVSYLYAYSVWVWLVPLLMIVYCYWYIVAAVAAHEKAMKEQAKKMGVKSLRGDQDAQKKSADCKLAKVALVTVSLWFMAWTPYLVINMAGLIDKSVVTPLFSIWGSVFAKANTVYNPIVYAISHPKYKAALYQKLPWLQCATDAGDDQDSKSTASNATTSENKA